MWRYVLGLALALCVGSAHAEQVKILQRLPVGPYAYVLHANGNIFTDNGLFRKQLDDGTGTLQLVGERDNLFILKKGSEIWWYNGQRWTLVDDYEGTTRLDFVNGACVAFKTNGESYRCALSKNKAGEWIADWSKLPPAPAPVASAASVTAGTPRTPVTAGTPRTPVQVLAPVATVAAGSPESSSFTR